MNNLKISHELTLPLDAVTQTFAILAVKGSGKTYTASVMAEEMLRHNQQIVVLDVTGAWYGLKSSSDGKGEGYQIAVFGGDHADVPLHDNAGEIIATAIVEKGFSAIIDLSLFRKGQMIRFLAIFLETLYRLNRKPLHLFADEADDYIPQKVFGEQARTVGAMEDIVKRGRKKGIGASLITQRPASINKDVLTQCEILVALRMTHPRDIDAIEEWIKVHSSLSQANEMIKTLPSLQTGIAYVWSPSWLKKFVRIAIRKRQTFDSGATPKPGEKVRTPSKTAFIDIKKLGEEIEQTVEKSRAEDPRELKLKIKELEAQLQKQKVKEVIKNVPSFSDAQLKKIESSIVALENMSNKHGAAQSLFWGNFNELSGALLSAFKHVTNHQPVIQSRPVKTSIAPIDKPSDSSLGKAEKLILTALAQYPDGRKKTQIAILTGYSHNGGSFNNALGKCRSNGWAEGRGDNIKITESGLNALGRFTPLPVGRDLMVHWMGQLGKAERVILQVLWDAHPKSLTKDEIGAQTGYESNGGSFNNALGKLRSLELIEGRGDIKASNDLF